MDGPRLHSQQGQRDTQPSWPPPSARPEPALSLTGSWAEVKMKLLQRGELVNEAEKKEELEMVIEVGEGREGARAFCWWSRVWFSGNVRFVTTSPPRSSWIIHHERSRRASLELSVTQTFFPVADGWETAERQYPLSLIFNLAVQVEGGCAVGGSFTTQLPKINVGNLCVCKPQIYCNLTFPNFQCSVLCCDNTCLWSN